MIRQAKDKKRRKADKQRRAKPDKEAFKGMPQPDPSMVGAILAILLGKIGGTLVVSMETLEEFKQIQGPKFPEIIYDEVHQSVIVRLPEQPDTSVILSPDKTIMRC